VLIYAPKLADSVRRQIAHTNQHIYVHIENSLI
jgi:hypothetical protein